MSKFNEMQAKQQQTSKPPKPAPAPRPVRYDRQAMIRTAVVTFIDYLVGCGGRASPSDLRLKVKCDPRTRDLALEHMSQHGILERAGASRSSDWCLTARVRAELEAEGRVFGKPSTRITAVAQEILDALEGEGYAPPPLLSRGYLREALRYSWRTIDEALNDLVTLGLVEVRSTGGVRLTQPETTSDEALPPVEPAPTPLAERVAQSHLGRLRTANRERAQLAVMGFLAARPEATGASRDSIKAALHIGTVLLQEVLTELEVAGGVERRMNGGRPAGWVITQAGREALLETAPPQVDPQVSTEAARPRLA
jgi:hypothetical protein